MGCLEFTFKGEVTIARTKLLVAGYYGCGNLGDDALLAGFVAGLGSLPVEVTALSGNPESTYRNLGVASIPRRDMSAIKRELENSSALVFAGGGLLQDVTSGFSLRYYTNLVQLGKRMGKPVFMLAQGIGPITGFLGKGSAKSALTACDILTVRDQESYKALRALGVKRTAEVTADLAWLCPSEDTQEGEFGLGTMKSVGIAIRPWKKSKKIAEAFGGFIQLLFRNNYVPVLIEMDRTMDTQLMDAIAKMHGGRCPDIRNIPNPAVLIGRLKRMNAVVAMRLHAGILAASVGIAPLMVSYDPKINGFCGSLGLPAPLPIESISAESLWEAFRKFEAERESLNKIVEQKKPEMTSLAMKNVNIMSKGLPQLAEASGQLPLERSETV